MLANMSQIDPRAELVDWSDLGVSGLLPAGTATLLLADVEGSTRLWETQPEEMTAAFGRLDHALGDLVSAQRDVLGDQTYESLALYASSRRPRTARIRRRQQLRAATQAMFGYPK
jgi:hypothetical protein